MINMDQVRTLEMKVKQTVQLIVHLRKENDGLRGRLSDTEVRLQELETVLESLKVSQNEMESGIRSALQELDHLDEKVLPLPESESNRELEPNLEPEPFSELETDSAMVSAEDFESAEGFKGITDDEIFEETHAEPEHSDEPVEEPEPQQPGLGIF